MFRGGNKHQRILVSALQGRSRARVGTWLAHRKNAKVGRSRCASPPGGRSGLTYGPAWISFPCTVFALDFIVTHHKAWLRAPSSILHLKKKGRNSLLRILLSRWEHLFSVSSTHVWSARQLFLNSWTNKPLLDQIALSLI